LKRLTAVVQLVIWWALLAMACFSQNLRQRPVNRILAYAGLLALAASPMALNCSNEFQLDSFFGFVMAGSVVLALAVWDKGCLHPRASRALFFLASAFLGLGKNEWSLVLLVALILLLLYACIPCLAGDAIWRRQAWACVGWSLLGLLAGNLVNWLFEPQLYMSGWNLLYYMVGHASLAKSACAVRFGQLTLDRLPFIQVHVALLLYLAWRFLAVKPAPSPTCLLAGAFGAGLFLAFFFSTWDSIPRYFAPAFIALSATALWAHATWPRNATQPAVLITMCVFAWWGYSGYAFAHSENLRNQCVYGVHSVTVPKTVDNIPLLRVEDAYRRPELDFVHSSCGIEEARRLIRDYGSHKHPFVP
ncbi:MAG: hypothetical protein NTY53_23545, partial [Kiritimatiellaeota bacterium]|nr:hypothetical protein [Kiritimatiellota bacterium]